MVNSKKSLFSYGTKVLVTFIILLFVLDGCRQNMDQAEIELPSDDTIRQTIETQFAEVERVPEDSIQVDVKEGIVTLSGTTTNLLAKKEAAEISESVKGVLSVINNLRVTADRPDGEIRDDVVRALATDPATEFWEILPEVNDGVVTLTGIVDSWQESRLAKTVAQGVKGVRAVNNAIDISYDENRTDDEIKSEIKQTLLMDSRIADKMVNVTVTNGKVKLSGSVGSLKEKKLAIQKAHVTGVSSVKAENLEVRPEIDEQMFVNEAFEQLTNAEIKEAILRTLKYDPRVPEEKIEVSISDKTAILSGTVKNLNSKIAAGKDARNTAGITEVVNNINVEYTLVVQPEIPTSDEAIQGRIIEAINRNPYIEGTDFTISVNDGEVTLGGTVSSDFEKGELSRLIQDVKGVVAIENNVSIAGSENT